MITRPLHQVASLAGAAIVGPRDGTGPDAAPVSGVVTDSRRAGPGSLFVAIAGERTDGHAHVGQAARAGAAVALVADPAAARSSLVAVGVEPDSFPLLVVPDTVGALGELARGHLADLRGRARARGDVLTVVAVTGSVGKTTTKDLTRQLLAAQSPTVAPAASFNNEIGLPLTVLETDESTRYLVLEMGASGPGHIAYLTRIAPLDAAAVLVIGHAHMGGFGSIDGVAAAKSEIIAGLVPTGTAVLNADDERALAMSSLAPADVLTFSATGGGADLRATDVRVGDGARASFNLHAPGLADSRRVRLALPGAHNVVNALAAAGLAMAAGVPARAVATVLGDVRIESPHRMEVHEVALGDGPGGVLLIDDSYNANIDSMSASLASLPALAGDRRRVVVISEMLELGESSVADHARTGELAARAGTALLIAIGSGAAPTARTAARAGVETIEVADAEAALALLDSPDSPLRDADAVLVKGSHDSGAWRVADRLRVGRRGPKGSQETREPEEPEKAKEMDPR